MNPYIDAQHHDQQYYARPEPHLPLRRASSQRLHAAREGPRPLFTPQQHNLRGFKPSAPQPAAQVNNITASTEHAFAGRDERSKAPFRPPLGVQAMQRSPVKSRYPSGQSDHSEHRRGKTPSPLILQGSFDAGRTQPSSPLVSEVSQTEQIRQPLSPLSPMASQSMQDISRRLRGSKSVGEGLRGKQRSTSDHSNKHSPVFQTDGPTDFMPSVTGITQHDIRNSMLSAVTWQSSRVNSGSVNTEHSSFITVNSSISDFMHVSAGSAEHEERTYLSVEQAEDKEPRISFDVDDAIGMYENGFESVKNSMDERRPSADQRPNTAHGRSHQPNYRHRRSQSASVLDRFSAPTTNGHASFVGETNTSSTTAVPRDRYGFKTASHYVTAEQYDRWNRNYTDHLDRRRRRWQSMMESYGLSTDNPIRFPPKSDKIKRYVRKGIPPEWRGAAWFWYAGGPGLLKKDPEIYKRLLNDVQEGKLTENDREHIERDLNRTFPDNIRFKPETTLPQDGRPPTEGGRQSTIPESTIISALRRVLQAFAVHNPSVGYCQSLNFIAGLLLLFLDEDEEKAFILLDLITSTHLPGTHGVTLEGANIDIAVLMSCIKDSLPNVWAKLDDKADPSALPPVAQTLRLPTVSLATTAWFMSLFVGTLPIECVLRAWDCLFFEGSKTLFRIALAIFKYGEKQIVGVSDPMEIFQMVQTIPRSMLDVNALMEVCFKRRGGFGYLSQDVIERRREERRKQVKAGISDEGGWRSRLRSKTTKI